jgi:hypothetical protein
MPKGREKVAPCRLSGEYLPGGRGAPQMISAPRLNEKLFNRTPFVEVELN